jgi:hypothetical protein
LSFAPIHKAYPSAKAKEPNLQPFDFFLVFILRNLKKIFMKNIKIAVLYVFFFTACNTIQAQELFQTIHGRVIDKDSKVPIPYATIVIEQLQPSTGTLSDTLGYFTLSKVPIGRYNIKVSCLGYEPYIIPELLVTSGKEPVLDVQLTESVTHLEEVVIKAKIDKNKPINSMALISARSFTVEETRRYAGSLDDPLRAASAFGGVVMSNYLGENRIVVRGNSPKGILWRLDEVDIPNPNHFGGIGYSHGGVAVFSSQLLTNSDFYTGAFPSDYGNALASVFDIKFRNGNYNKREYTFQAGLLGVEASAEGPFKKGGRSTYLVNYRYSTFGLAKLILTDLANISKIEEVPIYQDLSFKINIPTKKYGEFSILGIGGLSYDYYTAETDSSKWDYVTDPKYATNRSKLKEGSDMGAVIISNNYIISPKTRIKTSISSTINRIFYHKEYLNDDLTTYRVIGDDKYYNTRLSLSSYVKHKFSSKLINKTGFTLNRLDYNMDLHDYDYSTETLEQTHKGSGGGELLQAYTQFKYSILKNVEINAGCYMQHFFVNGDNSIEPRLAVRWNINAIQSVSFGYGNHSQLEEIGLYLAEKTYPSVETVRPNENLKMSKANHFIISYDLSINEYTRIKVEPYYQYLYNIPVIDNSPKSALNYTGLFTGDSLINKGTGRNVGIDFTIERFLKNNFYYLATASLFDVKYTGGDDIERNGRWDNTVSLNILAGKEFKVGKSHKNNLLGLNGRITVIGGERDTPIDEAQSIIEQTTVHDWSKAYTERLPTFFNVDFTITFRKNKPKHSSIWALQIKNLLYNAQKAEYYFDKYSQEIKQSTGPGLLPFISYKIEF